MSRWSECYDVERDAVVLHVHVQPSAGRTAVVGRHGNAVKIRVAAPPVDDRANQACAALLAELVGIAAGAVELAGGARSRLKRFRLPGVEPDLLETRLDAALESDTGPRPSRRP
jgi:uncharacterized protein (TIGR00251 family)